MSKSPNTTKPKLSNLVPEIKRFSPELLQRVPTLKLNQPKSTAWFSNDTSLSQQEIKHFVSKLQASEDPAYEKSRLQDGFAALTTQAISVEEDAKSRLIMDSMTKINEPLHALMKSKQTNMIQKHTETPSQFTTTLSRPIKRLPQPKMPISAPDASQGGVPLAPSTMIVTQDRKDHRAYAKPQTTTTDFENKWPEVEHDEDSGGVSINPSEDEGGVMVEEELDEMKIITTFINKSAQ